MSVDPPQPPHHQDVEADYHHNHHHPPNPLHPSMVAVYPSSPLVRQNWTQFRWDWLLSSIQIIMFSNRQESYHSYQVTTAQDMFPKKILFLLDTYAYNVLNVNINVKVHSPRLGWVKVRMRGCSVTIVVRCRGLVLVPAVINI